MNTLSPLTMTSSTNGWPSSTSNGWGGTAADAWPTGGDGAWGASSNGGWVNHGASNNAAGAWGAASNNAASGWGDTAADAWAGVAGRDESAGEMWGPGGQAPAAASVSIPPPPGATYLGNPNHVGSWGQQKSNPANQNLWAGHTPGAQHPA